MNSDVSDVEVHPVYCALHFTDYYGMLWYGFFQVS